MTTITIDDKEFNTDDLSDDGKALLNSIQFARTELIRLNAQASIYKRAEISYAKSLKEILEKK